MIQPHTTDDDASDFIEMVWKAAWNLLIKSKGNQLYLLHIDNWFGPKWHRFSGKARGALGVWQPGDHPTLPPFVPNRVLAQQRWILEDSELGEVSAGAPVHLEMPSGDNLVRSLADVHPESSFLWYSGNTRRNGRGSIMAYIQVKDGYWTWYASLMEKDQWVVDAPLGIDRTELKRLLRAWHIQ